MSADPRLRNLYRNSISSEWVRYRNEFAVGPEGWNSKISTTNDSENNVKLLQNKILGAYAAYEY
jgi:hypothetical protein